MNRRRILAAAILAAAIVVPATADAQIAERSSGKIGGHYVAERGAPMFGDGAAKLFGPNVAVGSGHAATAASLRIPYLHKATARRYAVRLANRIGRDTYESIDWIADWGVWTERSAYSKRRDKRTVDFDVSHWFYDVDDIDPVRCDVVIRAWRYRDGPNSELVTTAFTLDEPDCYSEPL